MVAIIGDEYDWRTVSKIIFACVQLKNAEHELLVSHVSKAFPIALSRWNEANGSA